MILQKIKKTHAHSCSPALPPLSIVPMLCLGTFCPSHPRFQTLLGNVKKTPSHPRSQVLLGNVKKKLRGIIITGIALCFVLPLAAQFGGGEGTADNPWQIDRPEHLNNIRGDFLNDHFIQTADIDLGVAPYNEGEGWEPIGGGDERFRGHYNGDYYTISNLTQNRQAGMGGLFATLDGGGSIVNVSLRDVELDNPGRQTGALVGWSFSGTINNCSSIGTVIGGSNVGGLIGRSNHTNISYCYTKGSVTGTGSFIGGLVGQYVGASLTDSYTRASVTGGQRVGGAIGLYHMNTVARCYATGEVTGQGDEVGGFIGRYHVIGGVNILSNYWDTETSGQEESEGGDEVMGRRTRQMIYDYDETTYVGWDFEEIWQHDAAREVNDGYPVLYYQEVEPPVILDPPVVEVEFIMIGDERHARLTWQAVEDAESYKVYVSDDPLSEDWGEPVGHTSETSFNEPIDDEIIKKFYHVVASTGEAP